LIYSYYELLLIIDNNIINNYVMLLLLIIVLLLYFNNDFACVMTKHSPSFIMNHFQIKFKLHKLKAFISQCSWKKASA